jgi:hypothetical protein
LRRFAFVMWSIVPGAARYHGPTLVALSGRAWRVDPVVVAGSFRERLAGIHSGGAKGVLLHTSTVHGMGLDHPLRVLHVTRYGTVVGEEMLRAGGIVRARAYWILEVQPGVPAPALGVRLAVLPSSLG